MTEQLKIGHMTCGQYKHFKGGMYLLLGIAEHTTTEETLAIYVSLDASLPGPRMRARPLAEFVGYVEILSEMHSIVKVPRFEFVGDKQDDEQVFADNYLLNATPFIKTHKDK